MYIIYFKIILIKLTRDTFAMNNINPENWFCHVISSPVPKYRKSYCSHPIVGIGVAHLLKFLVKVFISLYLLNLFMDQNDTLHVGRYWSEILCCSIVTHLGDLEVKVTDLEILC